MRDSVPPSLFKSLDYRDFLRRYIEHKKAGVQGFSYRQLSQRAGLASKSFLHDVTRGKRTLSASSAVRVAQAMKLSKAEAAYFQVLVCFNQARSLKEQDFFFQQLMSVRPRTAAAAYGVGLIFVF